jgi:hypothetical protein
MSEEDLEPKIKAAMDGLVFRDSNGYATVSDEKAKELLHLLRAKLTLLEENGVKNDSARMPQNPSPRLYYTKHDPERKRLLFEHRTSDPEKNARILIIPLDEVFARITGADSSSSFPEKEVPLDETKYTLEGDEAGPSRMVQGSFAVAFSDTYVLKYEGEVILRLECERQQALHGIGGCFHAGWV